MLNRTDLHPKVAYLTDILGLIDATWLKSDYLEEIQQLILLFYPELQALEKSVLI